MTNRNLRIRTDLLLLLAFCGFLFFYGLGAFGLLGADEPRYAQIAREMLNRSDWITPTLNGKPWLEKPPLYYWQAMLSYRVARAFLPARPDEENGATGVPARPDAPSPNDGVTEQTARFPAAIDAALMIAAIYLFLRRFRPGTELDGALITASSAAVIGFSRAAATDMPLAACFTIALLSWYAWYENRRSLPLASFYFFLVLGTLAKGPVAPALAAVIIVLFAFASRDRAAIFRTLWLPGILLYLAVALPWYIAVQLRNPEFFRFFIIGHNLGRFTSNVYHHPQPFWFFIPVFLLAAAPWTIWLLAAIVERLGEIRRRSWPTSAASNTSWPLFLLIWMFVPIVFFSLSQSKLPGYILPAVPAAALLVADHFARRRSTNSSNPHSDTGTIPLPLAAAHGLLCGLLVFAALVSASIATTHHLTLSRGTYISAAIAAVFALGISAALITSNGLRLVRSATMIAVIVSVAAVIRLAAPAIDATQSARPLAATILSFSREPVPVALFHVSRIDEYGIEFYLNRPTQKYELGEIPSQAHVLVAASDAEAAFRTLLGARKVSYLSSVPAQKLNLYWVGR